MSLVRTSGKNNEAVEFRQEVFYVTASSLVLTRAEVLEASVSSSPVCLPDGGGEVQRQKARIGENQSALLRRL